MRARLLPVLLALTVLVAACSGSSGAEDATAGDTAEGPAWTFTDDFDVTHELDAMPETIVAEVSIAGALWDLGYEVDATFGQRELPDGTTDPMGLADPEAIDSLGEEYGKVNVEQLRRLQPDLIVVPSYLEGEYWGIDEELVDAVERAAPVVSITIPGRDMVEMADRVAELAETLGVDLQSDQVVAAKDAYATAEADLRAALEAKPGLTFMAASGTVDQLYIAVPSGYADLLTYQRLGMDIVDPDTDEEFWQTLSWEEIDTYEADVLLGDSRGGSVDQIVEQIPEGARDLPAIESGQLARWEVTYSPGYANLARILTDLTAVVETSDPDVV